MSEPSQRYESLSRGSVPTETNTGLQRGGHIAALDGLRGIAILLVVFHHAWPYIWSHPAYSVLSTIKHVGWIGVDLFFVLSGFLITGILLDTREQPGALRNFLARRSLRVFPLYYFVLVLSFTFVPALLTWMRPDAAAEHSTTLAPAWFVFYGANFLPFLTDPSVSLWVSPVGGISDATTLPEYLAVTWSLCVEEQFYLLWPLVIYCTRRSPFRLILALCLAAIALRVAVVLNLDHWQSVTYMSTACRGDSLLVGAALAVASRHVTINPIHWQWMARIAAFFLLPAAVFWIIRSGGRGNPAFAAFGYTAVALGFGGWVALAISSRPSVISRLLEQRSLRWLGKYSYGLYLYHMIVIAAFQAWRPARMSAGGSVADPEAFQPIGNSILIDAPVRTLLIMAVSMLVAWLSFRCLESPFLRLKRFFECETPNERRASPVQQSSPASPAPTLGSI